MSIFPNPLSLAIAAAAILVPVHTIASEQRSYLEPQAAAAVIADGVAWSARAPNGRTFKLTLNKDGAGSIEGPLNFKLAMKWTIKNDTVCLSGTMMSKCLRFQEIPGGVQGWNGDEPDLKLTR